MTPERSELRALLRLGAPIMLAQTFQMGLGVVDTVMAGRYSATDLAGVALANAGIVVPLSLLLMGVLHAVTPIVAQLYGAGRTADVGAETRQGVWLGLLAAALGILALGGVDRVIGLFGAEPAVAPIAVGYARAVRWGLPGVALYFVFRNTCDGLGRTRPAMVIAGASLFANVALNYAFVYGRLGAPELGGVGCGVATAIVNWLQCAAILLWVTRPFYRQARIFSGSWRPDLRGCGRIARIGLPIGVESFLGMALFSLVTLLLAPFGAATVAAHSIALTMNGVGVITVPLGFAMAATIRVGHGVGAGDHEQARVSGEVAVRASIGCALAAAAVFVLLRAPIAGLFTHSDEVVAIGSNLLLFVAGYLLVDNTSLVATGILRGYKDTRVPMLLTLVAYWLVALPVALACGFGWSGLPGWGVYGFWIGLTVGLACGALVLNVRRVRLAGDPVRIERFAAT